MAYIIDAYNSSNRAGITKPKKTTYTNPYVYGSSLISPAMAAKQNAIDTGSVNPKYMPTAKDYAYARSQSPAAPKQSTKPALKTTTAPKATTPTATTPTITQTTTTPTNNNEIWGGGIGWSAVNNVGNQAEEDKPFDPGPQKPNTSQPGIEYQIPKYDPYAQIREAAQQRIASQLAQIKAAYEKSRSGVRGAIPGIQQQAERLRNENDAMYYTQQLPELRAALEQAGLYKGGAMPEGVIKLSTARGQNLGNINQSEANQLNELQETLRQLDFDEQQANIAAQSGIEADLMDKLAQAQQWLQDYNLRYGEAVGSIDGVPTLEAIQQAYNQAVIDAGLTGYYQGQPTADEKYRQWQQKLQEDQVAWERSADNPAVKAQILANKITSLRLQYLPQELDLQLRQIEQDIQAGRVNMEQARAQIAQIEEQSALDREKFNFEKSISENAVKDAKFKNAVDSYIAQINQYFNTSSYDPYTGKQTGTTADKAKIVTYIQNLDQNKPVNFSEDEWNLVIDELLRYYGLPLGR
jgi:hypothetical protein